MSPIQQPIESIDVAVYHIPTDAPESDGTLEWDATTLVLVEAWAGGVCGLGYTYASGAAAYVIREKLAEVVRGCDALDVTGAWTAMVRSVRNLGRPGCVSMAIAAVDTALWDLKARLLNLPLVKLLGMVRTAVPVYGSGGFTSYSLERLREQLGGWAAQGIKMVKMKVGRDPDADGDRIYAAREAIGPTTGLFVDANGALTRKQALAAAWAWADLGVRWFEEPVSSDDLEGLRLIRDHGPPGMAIAAGEYGYDLFYFRRMLEAGAVDVLQADVTRCAGITEFMRIAALCAAHAIPLSAHTAPTLHTHLCCALDPVCHVEYFYDHVRIEQMFFDGLPELRNGLLYPDLTRPGMGLALKSQDVQQFLDM